MLIVLEHFTKCNPVLVLRVNYHIPEDSAMFANYSRKISILAGNVR